MFSRVLIANRGEIAVRVQQTLQGLGITTIAVYSDPDATAPHVAQADEAYPLHGQTAEETYLNVEKLLDIARAHQVEAVHPGYGFLSENAGFARACREADLIFIGPTPESMEALGDKISSKEIAQHAKVPTVPSSPTCDRIDATVQAFVAEWDFPLLVKAAAGGGGRGMRLVYELESLPAALESANREAAAAFGDGRVFLEKYIPRPRHVEIQLLADQHGHTLHLLERECSGQRRHQKILEETPSPALTPELRQQMGAAAVAVAQAADYHNAGTAEFLLDPETGQFYFLEMNTRLQVEHPITEAILGIDMVAWQVRIASGEPLTLRQEDISANGHAIEARIYAEDPYHSFLPSVGTLLRWRPPSGPGLRLDSGVVEGQEVTTFYDPLLAKLIAWGPDRVTALQRMDQALSNFPVLGVVTNISFLREVIRHPHFRAGDYDTTFLETTPAVLRPHLPEEIQELAKALAAWGADNFTSSTALPISGVASLAPDSPWRSAGPLRLP
jgi:propionyl-CoA carboxylase alpha chain